MSTEVASLLVTAEGQTGDAERALDRLGIKYDQTVERMRGAQGRFVGFADANKLAAAEIKRHGEAIDVLRGRLQAGAADLQRFGAYLTAGVTVPMVGAGAAAVKFAGDLQSSVSLIRTIRPDFDTSKVFDTLSVLQTRIPQTSAQLGEAAYNIVSSLDDIGEAATLNLTEKFGKGATSARVDALAFGTAILGVLNAYKLKVTDVDHVQDLFFQTVNRGIITGAELSSELASVSKAAQNAGVDLDTLMALIVGATKEAGPAAENMTQLSQVLNQFTAKEAQKGLKELGIATHDAKGNFLPMVGILEQVKAKYDQLSEVDKSKLVQGLFPDIRSQKGFATLLRELDSVKAALADPSTAGAADRAFETVSKTFNFQFAIFLNTVRHAFESIGAEILPVVIPIVKALGEMMRSAVQTAINAWKQLPAGAKAAVVALLGFVASLGPVLTVLGTIAVAVLGVAGSIGSVVTAVAAAGGLAALSEILVPVGAVILGIVVLLAELAATATLVSVTIYKAWTTNFLGIRDLTLQAWGAVKSFVLDVWREMQGAYQLIMPELVQLTRNVLAGITALWGVFGKDIVAVVRYIWNTVAPTFKAGLVIISSLVAGVLALINGNWQKAWDMAVRIVETFLVRLATNIARIYFAIAMIPVYILQKIGEFVVAGGKLAIGLVEGFIAEVYNNAPRMAAACIGVAIMLTNPSVLAAYAAVGIAQARARNQAFDAALKNGPGERYSDEGEYVTPGSQTPKDDGAGSPDKKGGGAGLPKGFGGGGGKGGGGGESAARKAYRLQIQEAETALSAIERVNQRSLADQEYFYSEGKSLLEDYVAARKAAADKLFAAEQTRAAAEMAALRASALKGKEREVEEGKLNEKALADKQKYEVALTEIERYANKQRDEIQKAAWQGKIDLLQETASGFEAVYQRMAEQGVMSFRAAVSNIDNAHMEILIAQKVHVERELEKVTKGTKQYTELSAQLDAIAQRIENFRAQMNANSEDADRKDLDSKRNYQAQLRGIYQGITDLEMQSQRDRLQILEQMGLKKEIVWRRELELSLAQAEVDKQRRVEDLERQRDYIAQTEKNEERRLELIKSINDQIAAEERRSTQVRENIVADFYEKQRQKLRDWADKIVGGLKSALDAYKTNGLKGFFASLAQSFRDVLEQMALDLLKARVLKLLQTVFKVPQVDPGGATTNTTGINGGAGGGGFGNIFSQLFQGIFGSGKGPANPADAVTQAGSAATKAIKDGWGNSTGAIDKAGTAQAKTLQTVGQQIVGTMLQIGAALAAGNTGMGFFKGLLFAAASGALSSLGGSLGNKLGSGGGGGPTMADSPIPGVGGRGDRAAMGGMFAARPGGRFIQIAEGGYDELVLTTDPAQRGRMANLMAAYMRATGISAGSFAQGGFTSGFTPPSIATAARYGGAGKRFVQVNLTQEIHTNDPQAFQRTARQNARAARGALSSVLNP